MTREEAIRELREDKALYETDICHAGDGSPDGDLLEALNMAIEALKAEPEWTDKIGEPCYKIYVTKERYRFPGTYWDYFVDTKSCLDFWKRHISLGGEGTLYVKLRPFTKSDRGKLGSTVFWTEDEAKAAIGIERKEQNNE